MGGVGGGRGWVVWEEGEGGWRERVGGGRGWRRERVGGGRGWRRERVGGGRGWVEGEGGWRERVVGMRRVVRRERCLAHTHKTRPTGRALPSPHPFQHNAAATLCWEVDLLADVGPLTDQLQQLCTDSSMAFVISMAVIV